MDRYIKRGILSVNSKETPSWDENHGDSIVDDDVMNEISDGFAQPRHPTTYDDIEDEKIVSQPHPFKEDDDMTQSDTEEAHDDDEDAIPLQLKESSIHTSDHTIFTQALEKENSGDGASAGHKDCLKKTLMIFKGHLQNSLSVIPDQLHAEKVQEWKETLKENKVDQRQILNLFNDEMQTFVDIVMKIPAHPVDTCTIELFEDMLADKLVTPKQPKFVQLKPPVEKKKSVPALLKGVAKKNQTKCRACGGYFRKGPENKFICQKVECQNRKCKQCEEDRVCFKTKKCCKKCFGAK